MILFCISCLFRGVPSWVDSGRIGISILSPEGENGNHAASKRTVVPYYTIQGAIPREVIESYDLVVETI